MPTYEYECEKCHKNFELVQSMKETAIRTCRQDVCRMRSWGKGRVRRLLSTGAGLIFKGSGFYITDYRSENYKQAAKKEKDAASGGKDGGDAASGKKETSSTKETAPTSGKKTEPAKTA
ncbi:MAG: zinc ribbon domain-containing protein [Verrucomicrobia bacterium]|nr:zinc ribbon domain-containing protein [Verrucomicrobiota bacterium]